MEKKPVSIKTRSVTKLNGPVVEPFYCVFSFTQKRKPKKKKKKKYLNRKMQNTKMNSEAFDWLDSFSVSCGTPKKKKWMKKWKKRQIVCVCWFFWGQTT